LKPARSDRQQCERVGFFNRPNYPLTFTVDLELY
jgi:hypothetical protein